ncbi:ketoacyl-ACP synthase III family protein [Kitasatospora griseola]|uniref:ketoacyl-ACP synthase III family protein n=1 Tax=Kitasatospora griseola TaxID=2064 RepID=UPI0016716703|nr:ketoacyl-ACP synthase III family protein [Kitasatospora griseola]
MRYPEIFIAGGATELPPAQDVRAAVAAGRLDARIADRTEALAVTVSDGPSGPELAARAARRAFTEAGAPGLDLLLHATVYYQGHDLWAPASYVQREVLADAPGCVPCPAVEIRQLSNGGMAALELAAGYLAATPGRGHALLTAGDRFEAPGFDRWNGDPGTHYADGGSALLLSNRDGFARLRSLATVSAPELEGMHRGDDPFGAAPFAHRPVVDMETTKRAFVSRTGVGRCTALVSAGQRRALETALDEAGNKLADIDWFVLPHLGRRRLEAAFFTPFGIDPERSTWPWSRAVGHLGAGDQFAGLDHLRRSGALRPGQLVLLVGIGAGFTWSCAVIEVLGPPRPSGKGTEAA